MAEKTQIECLFGEIRNQLELNVNNFDDAISVCGGFRIEKQTLFDLSSIAISQKAYDYAYVFAKAASKSQNKKIRFMSHHNAGVALQSMGILKLAEKEYQLVLELNPNHFETHYNYGILLQEMDNLEAAEREIQKVFDINSDHVGAHFNYGILLKKKGSFEAALKEFEHVIQLDPNYFKAYCNYGVLLQEMGKFESAEEKYQLALELNPNYLNAYFNYGILLQEMGKFESAEEKYQLALKIDSNHFETHLNYGILLQKMGKLKAAEESYQFALKVNSSSSILYYNYGVLLQEMGKFESAEEKYQLALKINPIHLETHLNYGNLLQLMNSLEAAEKKYQFVIQSNPEYASAHGAYSILLFRKGNFKKSVKESEKASELYKKKGNRISEHLSVAWVNNLISDKYYKKGVDRKKIKGNSGNNFRKSGKYAFAAGAEYVLAGENAKGEERLLYLTKGYTLKGRAEIRRLSFSKFEKFKFKFQEFIGQQSFAELREISSRIQKAAEDYEQVAELSTGKNSSCSACCSCMGILNEILDCINAATTQKRVPDLKEKSDEWNKKLDSVESIYECSTKGTNFVHALRQMISSLSSFESFKTKGRLEFERNLSSCILELKEISDNIEGPLQEVIDKSAQQMEKCAMRRSLYIDATEAPILEKTSRLRYVIKWLIENSAASILAIVIALVLAYFGLTA